MNDKIKCKLNKETCLGYKDGYCVSIENCYGKEMKAWQLNVDYENYSTVVFAETRGKAKALARYTDVFEDASFCDMRVRRVPKLDKYYEKGKIEMDWCNPKDRIVLVKELDFRCFEIDIALCEECSAKKYCDTYKDEKERWE